MDYIIGLIESGYRVFPLRGNHEETLLEAFEEYDSHTFALFVGRINKSPDLLNDDRTIKSQYLSFISKLEYFYETDDFILIHAGINFASDNPFADQVSMLELRHTEPDHSILKGKRIVHGHQVIPLNEIEAAVMRKATVIPLDNGCFYNKPHRAFDFNQTGHLCCLNLDTFELTVQKNIENY
jgi:serine/threonine protein phosphatase 1